MRHPDWERIRELPSEVLFQLKSGGFRVLLLSESREEIWAFDEIQYTRNLDCALQINQMEIFAPKSFLAQATIRKVTISFDSEIFTLVPAPLFMETSMLPALSLVAEVPAGAQLFATHHAGQGFYLVHAIPGAWKAWANQLFETSEIQWISSLSGLLDSAVQLHNSTEEAALLAHIESGLVVLIGTKAGHILYANRFEFKSENDLLYFILLALNELGLNGENGRTIISGGMLPGSLGFEKLARYIAHLEFVRHETELYVPFGFEALHHHNYFDLLSLPAVLPVS